MNFKDLHPPILEIPAHQTWHRVQRTSARRYSVRLKGYVLVGIPVPRDRSFRRIVTGDSGLS